MTKLKKKCKKKMQKKKKMGGPFWVHFPQNSVLTSFFLILTEHHCPKLKKNLISRFHATLLSNRCMAE